MQESQSDRLLPRRHCIPIMVWHCLYRRNSLIIEQLRNFGGRREMPPFPFMAIKHFLQFADFTLDEFEYVIERARLIKRKFKNYEPHHTLLDRTLVMVFEKNSTRTRLSFEAGMHQLG